MVFNPVAAYLEERYVKVWGVCAFKSNNLCESSFKESKALDKAFTKGGSKTLPEFKALKALDDQNRFCSFGKGMLRAGTSNVVVNPTPQEETAQVPVQETQWSASSAVSFHHLRRISGCQRVHDLYLPVVAKTGVEDILRSIRSVYSRQLKSCYNFCLNARCHWLGFTRWTRGDLQRIT